MIRITGQAEIVKAGHSKTMQSFQVHGTALPRARNGLYWELKGEAADIVDARYLWSGPVEKTQQEFSQHTRYVRV